MSQLAARSKAPARAAEPAKGPKAPPTPAEEAPTPSLWADFALGAWGARTGGGAADDPTRYRRPAAFAAPLVLRSAIPGAAPAAAAGASPWSLLARSPVSHRAGVARLHTDVAAARAAEGLGAHAFTIGRDIYFGRGRFAPATPWGVRLLRHELAHVAQVGRDVAVDPQRGLPVADPGHPAEREAEHIAGGAAHAPLHAALPMVFRVPATPRPVARLTRDQLFGNAAVVPPLPGTDLASFQDYTEQTQADWFAEPTLSPVERTFLWDMLLKLQTGSHIRLGIGDVKLADLQGVAAGDWPGLEAFCRGTDPGQLTVRLFPPLPALADRIAQGKTLLALEAIIPADQLNVTVSQLQLRLLTANPALMPLLADYWSRFQPFLERTFEPAPGAMGIEFQAVLTFLITIRPTGLAPLLPLQGASAATRWVRNLHRFPLPMLNRLVANLADTSGARDFLLILHTGHDAVGAFQDAASLFSDLVLNTGAVTLPFIGVVGPDNLVLMIEGATTLADMTVRIPTITATWGKLDGAGNRHINQVLIAGHGSGHSVSLAGTSAPTVSGGHVHYLEESLDTVGNLTDTRALLDALMHHLDPATARLLYAGCLVGSRTVPAGTPAAGIPAALAADQSLGAFTEARATAASIPLTPGVTVQAARASVGLGALTALKDASGRLHPTYPSDPSAYGGAAAYAQGGLEPEGVLRAAVEVAATVNTVTAETMLRTRLALPARPTHWYDIITRLMVGIVLPPVHVPPTGVDLHLLNEAANTAEIPFLVHWAQFGWINAARYVTHLNPQPFAGTVYAGLAGTVPYTGMARADDKRMRIIVDQGQFLHTGAAATLLAGILATGLNSESFKNFLDVTPTVLGGREAALLPLVGAPTTAQIRLGLAWFARDSTNAHVRAFLSAQVVTAVGAAPAFNAATAAEIAASRLDPRTLLTRLGFSLTPAGAAPVGGGPPPPLANARVPGSPQNTVFVTPAPRVATVIPTFLNVRSGPSMSFVPMTVLLGGVSVNVAGTTGSWSAIDFNGRLGFVFTSQLTP
ncbi:uncharacterized protein DUF4157 [Plasticicumulans lactativorans]|uniref:Uncharacterized protein DUF4157 n=1 Tax=Plasticicumulans lactativorans TaxID=1133106 RepID=A0A4R2L3V0_9GAMM|nr:DUF4157 domain-containing protein [Plasticicumulans lactativorans]TCO80402.1 uncharacterized protein DUF4157 [Plasticicumulans lactativorans]